MPETPDTATGVIYTRKAPVRPKTFNDATRSVRVVAVTETPVYRSVPLLKLLFPVPIIVVVSGCQLPPSGQVPLLDSHNTSTVHAVLGSARNFAVVGSSLECDVFFSGTPAGLITAQKVREGHLTDFSIGFHVDLSKTEIIRRGGFKLLNGNKILGPAVIHHRWFLDELSVVFQGANPDAKAREQAGIILERMDPLERILPTNWYKQEAQPDSGRLLDRAFWGLILFILLAALIGLWR